MIGWLLYKANSATSMVCLGVAICVILVSRIPVFAQKSSRIFTFGLLMIIAFVVLESTIGLSKLIIVNVLGRDISLTTRVPMWFALIKMAGNPIVGVGYESFWLGERLQRLWQLYGTIHQAHNGYLEVFLNLGLIGLSLKIAIIISGFIKIQKQLQGDYTFAILKLIFLVIVVIYNWTEASFMGVNNIWLLMFFSVLDVSDQQREVRNHVDHVNVQSVDPKATFTK
jgi:O-antigen ligase